MRKIILSLFFFYSFLFPELILEKVIKGFTKQPRYLILNEKNNKIYAFEHSRGIFFYIGVIDCAKDTLIKEIYLPHTDPFIWTSGCNKLYLGEVPDKIYVLSGENDSIIDTIFTPVFNTSAGNAVYNPIYKKIYINDWGFVTIISEENDSVIRIVEDWGGVCLWNKVNNLMYWARRQNRDAYVDIRTSKEDSLLKSISSPIRGTNYGTSFSVRRLDTIRNILFGVAETIVPGGFSDVFPTFVDGNNDTILHCFFPELRLSQGTGITLAERHNKVYYWNYASLCVINYENMTYRFIDIGRRPGVDAILDGKYNWISNKLYFLVKYQYPTEWELVVIDPENDFIIQRFFLTCEWGCYLLFNWINNRIYITGIDISSERPETTYVIRVYKDTSLLRIEEKNIPSLSFKIIHSQKYHKKIFDISGKKIKAQKISSKGIYFLKEDKGIKKIIIY